MATPELIVLQCDHCGGCLEWDGSGKRDHRVIWPRTRMEHIVWQGRKPSVFANHSQAYAHGKAAGWYIAEVELCPEHAEAYAIEKASQEEVEP